MSFDLLIVGAGPAGSLAAEALAKAGKRVALFDGRPAGQPKACGGGVTTKALKAWPQLLCAVGRPVNDLELYSPSGKRLYLRLSEPFAIYSRLALDSFLRDRAIQAGAEVFADKISSRGISKTNGDWKVRSVSGFEWTGKVLVGADGAGSAIARMLVGPLPPSEMEVAFGYRTPLPSSSEAATVIAFLPDWMGYAWAFPRPDHLSFGIATTQEAFDHSQLDRLLWRFMVGYFHMRTDPKERIWHPEAAMTNSAVRKDLEQTAERYAARIPGLSETSWDIRPACGENWALIGDAAGFADPVTGEGIYYALRSAELLAQAYLEGNLTSYEQAWRADFGGELKRASQMRRRFYGNFWGAPFTERMIEFASGHPGIKQVLGDLIAGEQGYSDLKKKLVKKAFWPL